MVRGDHHLRGHRRGPGESTAHRPESADLGSGRPSALPLRLRADRGRARRDQGDQRLRLVRRPGCARGEVPGLRRRRRRGRGGTVAGPVAGAGAPDAQGGGQRVRLDGDGPAHPRHPRVAGVEPGAALRDAGRLLREPPQRHEPPRRPVEHPPRVRPRRDPRPRHGFVHLDAARVREEPGDAALPQPGPVVEERGERELRPRTARTAHRRHDVLRGRRQERVLPADRPHDRHQLLRVHVQRGQSQDRCGQGAGLQPRQLLDRGRQGRRGRHDHLPGETSRTLRSGWPRNCASDSSRTRPPGRW